MSGSIWDELAAEASSPADQERAQQLRQAQAFARQKPPEQAAAEVRAAKRTGLSPELVATDPNLVRAANEPDWSSLAREAPVTARTLSDPHVAAAAQDDVQTLSALEKLFGGWKDLAWETAEAWKRGRSTTRLAEIGYLQSQGKGSPELAAEADRLEALAAAHPPLRGAGLVARGVRAAVESTPYMLHGIAASGERVSQGGAAGLAAGAAAGGVTGPGAVVTAGAGLLAGAKAGLAVGTAEDVARLEQGLAYREYMQMPGVRHEQARLASTFVGIANGLLEVAPLHQVLQIPALKALLRGSATKDVFRTILRSNTGRAAVARAAARLAGGMTLEGLTEAAQELSTVLGGQAAQGEEVSVGRAFAEQGDRIVQAGVEGALAAGVMGGPGLVAGLASDVREARAGAAREAFWKGLGQAAAASKTRGRLEDAFHDHVAALVAEKGAPEAVSAPAEALTNVLHQNDITLEQIAQKMPAVARQLEEAAGNPGVEISIPTADFATHIAPLKGYEALVPDLRVGDELTIRERQKVQQETPKLLEEMKKAEGKPIETPEGRVVRDVAAKLEAAGVDADAAAKQAALWGAFASVTASRPASRVEEIHIRRADLGCSPRYAAPSGERVVLLADVVSQLWTARQRGARAVVLVVDSLGGEAMATAGLFEALRSLSQSGLPSVAYVVGCAHSAAAEYILAADYIVATPTATIWPHGAVLLSPSPGYDSAQYEAHARHLDRMFSAIATTRTGVPESEIALWFNRRPTLADPAGAKLEARRALELGYVDFIGGGRGALDLAERIASGEHVVTARQRGIAGRAGHPERDRLVQEYRQAGASFLRAYAPGLSRE